MSASKQPDLPLVEADGGLLGQALSVLTDSLKRLARGLTEYEEYDIPEREDLTSAAAAAARHRETLRRQFG